MNMETIAPWRSSAEEIVLAFVCSPLELVCSLWITASQLLHGLFGNHIAGAALQAARAGFDWK